MANAISRFKNYIAKLDTVYQQSATTAVLESDPETVKMGNKAGEFLIPKMSMDGLADYSRSDGYVTGSVSIDYETKACNYDRGRRLSVDAMDNEETAGIAFGKLASEFIRTKVKKPGAILIYSIVRSIMGGYLPYIILFILSGVIAELLLWKIGYGNGKALTISYIINQVFAAFGSTVIPYGIAAQAMADQMVSDGRQDNILAASEILRSWWSVALVVVIIAAAFVGATIGRQIVKKHLAA